MWRLFKRVSACFAGIIALIWIGSVILRPYLLDRQSVARIRTLSAEIASAEAENRALRQRIRFLQTEKGIEIEARRQGFVRPDEILIQPSETPAPIASSVREPHSTTPILGAVQREGHSLQESLYKAWQALRQRALGTPATGKAP